MEPLFFELGIVVISAAVVGVVGYFLRQPMIIAYMLAGILIGPFGLHLVTNLEIIHVVAKIGIMLLLFLVGLEMNPDRLRDLGKVTVVAGIGQVVFTFVAGFFLTLGFGFSIVEAAYISVGLTFSSTVIAVKIIYDQHDNNSLYGQITIGILLVQDVLAIIALLLLSGFQFGSFVFDYANLGLIVLKGILLAAATLLAARFILVYLYERIASSQELLILFSLSWAFAVTLVSQYIGFSPEIGAFLAGISLASLPYSFEINARAKILRDFFVTIFFVALGAGLVFSSIGSLLPQLIFLSLLVLIGNPLIVLLLMGIMGHDKRTAFFTGLAIANISEFSLFIFARGQALGHLSQEVVSMATIIGILTMTVSSYMMVYNNQLYEFLKKYLGIFEFRKKDADKGLAKDALGEHIVLLGCGQMGHQILEQLIRFKEQCVVVDHDNKVIRELIRRRINCIFGDIADSDLLREIDLQNAELVISTLPSPEDNAYLLRYVATLPKEHRPVVIVTAESGRQGIRLFNLGADYVILKPYLGASHLQEVTRELYHLEESVFENHIPAVSQGVFKSDHEYAQIMHRLNQMRLKEIKRRFRLPAGKEKEA